MPYAGARTFQGIGGEDSVWIKDLCIHGGPTGSVDVRIIRPSVSDGPLPVIMYFHGGGWIGGSKYTHDQLIRRLASKAKAAVIFVEYSLAPEAKYPVALEQSYHAVQYFAEHGKEYELDPSRLAVAGDSAGGNMAAVMAILAKQRNGPLIAYQVLFYPVTDADFNTGSYREFSSGYQLDRDTMMWLWDKYLPDVEARKAPAASPLRASLDMLKGLPPALVITAEHDVLRDEGEAYANKLEKAGVPTTAVLYPGMVHGFILHDTLVESPAADEAIDLAANRLHEALYR